MAAMALPRSPATCPLLTLLRPLGAVNCQEVVVKASSTRLAAETAVAVQEAASQEQILRLAAAALLLVELQRKAISMKK